MSYPFTQMPKWADFLSIAQAQGWELRIGRVKMRKGQRESPPVKYFRKNDGAIIICPELDPEQVLSPVLLSSLIRQLELDPALFGLTLGDLPPTVWP